MDDALIVCRSVQYVAAAIVCGMSWFFVYGVTGQLIPDWPHRLLRAGSIVGVLGVVGWLMGQTGLMGEASSDALHFGKVAEVATGTSFGIAGLARLGLFSLAFTLTFLLRTSSHLWLAIALIGTGAAASFAWSGHGVVDDGLRGIVHLITDAVHAVAGSVWIGALIALLALLLGGRARSSGARAALEGLTAFSRIGISLVAILVLTGVINSYFLLTLNDVLHPLATLYTKLLLIKLLLFSGMLVLATANRYVLTANFEKRQGLVLASVLTECLLGFTVLVVVGWLGLTATPSG